MRIFLLSLSVLILCSRLAAQHNPDQYLINGETIGDQFTEDFFMPDDDLFYVPIDRDDLFLGISEYNFSFVKYNHRGYDHLYTINMLGNLPMDRRSSSHRDYRLLSNLTQLGFMRTLSSGMAYPAVSTSGEGAISYFSPDIMGIQDAVSATIFTQNKAGRFGLRTRTAHSGERWALSTTAFRRWGSDGNIKGLFSDDISLGLVSQFLTGDNSSLMFIFNYSGSETASRSYTTKEVYSLRNSTYYNPSWGYYGGEQRSARINVRQLPTAAVLWSRYVGRTKVDISAGWRGGYTGYRSLAWFGADNPYPDYYRYLPGYIGNNIVRDELSDLWSEGDRATTLIDWDYLMEQNLLADEQTVYFTEERRERLSDYFATISSGVNINSYSSINYGCRISLENSRNHKVLRDLIGGKPFKDIDRYTDDGEDPGGKILNNIRRPDRAIGHGDRFGYDYSLYSRLFEAFASIEYSPGRFHLLTALSVGENISGRTGHYEKQNLPGRLSYGKSRKQKFPVYSVNASTRYSFSPRHSVSLYLFHSRRMPEAASLFVTPMYSNTIAGTPRTFDVSGVDASYRMVLDKLIFTMTFYASLQNGSREIHSYYDDISGTFSDMIVTGIDKSRAGAEIALRYDISPSLNIRAVAAYAASQYESNPRIEIVQDETLSSYVSGARSYLKGYKTGGSPEVVSSAEIQYIRRGWIASANVNYAGRRWVAPNPLMRMSRVYNLARTDSQFSRFTAQEKLADAVTLDIFLMKSFAAGPGRITALVSVNNLLDERHIIYNGFEQMRISKYTSNGETIYEPFDSKYMYSYGRSYYLSLSYKF